MADAIARSYILKDHLVSLSDAYIPFSYVLIVFGYLPRSLCSSRHVIGELNDVDLVNLCGKNGFVELYR